MFKTSLAFCLAAAALGITSLPAQAGQKIVSFSICAGSDCNNTPSQHNFTTPGTIKVPTGLPPAFRITRITKSCAAFCRHAALWPDIFLDPGHDGSYFVLDAHHGHGVSESSTARSTVYTLNITLHY